MKLVNLTTHSITEITTGKVYPVNGNIKISTSTYQVDVVNGSPIYKTKVRAIKGLPEPEKGVIYIVPALALNAIPEWRTDVVAPGNVKRDEKGNILGCQGFRIR